MSLFSKVFGKKKTVDTSHANQAQQPQQAAQNQGPNEQANAFDGFEVVNDIVPDGTAVADVYLNVDTESKSRSHMTAKELVWDNSVGHTWLTIKPLNGQLPDDLNQMVQPQTRTLVEAHGETAMGFWPLVVRHKRTEGKKLSESKRADNIYENDKLKAELSIRRAKGYTGGSGTILPEEAANYDLNSTAIGRDTAGRVEEPDDTHTPKGRKVYRITRKQFRDMYRYIDAHRTHKYNLYTYNCTTFAAHALKAAGQNVPMEGMTMPTSLYEAMYKEAKKHQKDAEKAKKRHQQVQPSSVQLLKLEEGEAHRKKGKSKEGPNGKDVRVKGVDKFNIPMYTDQAEVILKKVADAQAVTDDDKSLFIQYMFQNCSKRTLDGVIALTDEAARLHLITKGDVKDIVSFYMKDYHLIEDVRFITTSPELFHDYLIKILNVVPDAAVMTSLFDGKSLSPEHDLNKLCQRVIWNALQCDKTGDEFSEYVLPLNYVTFMDAMTKPMIDSFNLAVNHFMTHRTRGDLNRVMTITSRVFMNEERVLDIAKTYYTAYYNYKAQHFLLTDDDLADAQLFGQETQIPAVLASYEKIRQDLEISKQRQFYGTVTGGEKKVSALPKKFIKAKKQKNAPKPDENEVVAEAYLNVDTTNPEKVDHVSRSSFSRASVGHTWLTLKANPKDGQPGTLPADLEAEIQGTDTGRNTVNIIRAKGETAMGFWPLDNGFVSTDGKKYRKKTSEEQKQADASKNVDEQAMLDVRDYKGYTKGSGSVSRDQTQHSGYSLFKSVSGRVEEPDDAHTPKARKRFAITRKQFKKMYRYIEAHRNHKYNIYTYNCTTFAAHALRDAGHTAHGSMAGICYPARMYRELYDEAKRDARNNRVGNVQLKKLGENESHGEYRTGKVGENGADVRVKGVNEFNMIEDYQDDAEVTLRKFQLNPAKKADYTKDYLTSMVEQTTKRSQNEADRLADEALRIQLISADVASAVKTLYHNYKALGDHFAHYQTLDLSQLYVYLKSIATIAPFIENKYFSKKFLNGYSWIASKILEQDIDTAEYDFGIKICTEVISDNMDDSFEAAIEEKPLTEGILKRFIDLKVRNVYSSINNITNMILKLNQNNAEIAFDYVLDIYRDDKSSPELLNEVGDVLSTLVQQLPIPDVFNNTLKDLKNKGKLSEACYKQIMDIQKQLKAAKK